MTVLICEFCGHVLPLDLKCSCEQSQRIRRKTYTLAELINHYKDFEEAKPGGSLSEIMERMGSEE